MRQLNRATLARQLLLERAELEPAVAVEHLVGLQAQTPQSWYVGLWSRLANLDPARAAADLQERRLVRVPAMRSTIHLLAAGDALWLRTVTQPVVERTTMGSFGRLLAGVVRQALIAAARKHLAEPQTAAELGRLLAPEFPGRDPAALAQAARAWLPMVQVPLRGM